MIDPWSLAATVALSFAGLCAVASLTCLLVGLVLWSAGAIARDTRPAAPPAPPRPPPLVVARTLTPADGYERPALPAAPHRATLPRYVIPGRVDVSAPTEGMEHDEVGWPGDTVVSETTAWRETTPAGSTAWVRMPRPTWARGDRT